LSSRAFRSGRGPTTATGRCAPCLSFGRGPRSWLLPMFAFWRSEYCPDRSSEPHRRPRLAHRSIMSRHNFPGLAVHDRQKPAPRADEKAMMGRRHCHDGSTQGESRPIPLGQPAVGSQVTTKGPQVVVSGRGRPGFVRKHGTGWLWQEFGPNSLPCSDPMRNSKVGNGSCSSKGECRPRVQSRTKTRGVSDSSDSRLP
jgi:hypothetical protein